MRLRQGAEVERARACVRSGLGRQFRVRSTQCPLRELHDGHKLNRRPVWPWPWLDAPVTEGLQQFVSRSPAPHALIRLLHRCTMAYGSWTRVSSRWRTTQLQAAGEAASLSHLLCCLSSWRVCATPCAAPSRCTASCCRHSSRSCQRRPTRCVSVFLGGGCGRQGEEACVECAFCFEWCCCVPPCQHVLK